MKILYKVKAHFGFDSNKTAIYYVVAEDFAKAEKMVVEFHERKDYSSVNFCHIETIACADDYGKPNVLLYNIEI